jgi:hypothetical protein
MTQRELEIKAKVTIIRGWILDGAGPARYGYGRVSPCKVVWLGKTLAEASWELGIPLSHYK